MSDLAAWLLDQIAADEEPAREAADVADRYFGGEFEIEWTWARHTYLPSTGGSGHSFAPGAPSPARVLAECAAKRAIVEEHDGAGGLCYVCAEYDGAELMPQRWPCPTLRLLAQPYADRPGWREAWRVQ